MIISRTPFRISLFGGGTDYPQWIAEHGGAVMGMAIDKYCYISVRYLPPFFEHRHRVVYSHIENVNEIHEIKHPAVRAVMSEKNIKDGLEIHHDGDLPARSGLGSSSSFTVGLLAALNALEGRMIGKMELATEAIRIEQEVVAENVGCQDQIWAAYGGMNRIDFSTDGKFSVRPMVINRERDRELMESLMLFFTGVSRFASEIAGKKIENLKAKQANLHAMRALVDQADSLLTGSNGRATEIGEMLHESWMLKRDLASGVSNDTMDEIYQAGRDAGAIGGKLLGAGGGGFMLFYVEKQHQQAVRERLRDLVEVRFKVDRAGSTIVVYEPNGLENA